jgi:hypothetical protein
LGPALLGVRRMADLRAHPPLQRIGETDKVMR